MPSTTKRSINLLRGWPSASLLPTAALNHAATACLTDPAKAHPGLLYGPDWGYEPLRYELAIWLNKFYDPTRWRNTLCKEEAKEETVLPDPERLCVSGGASQNLANILQSFTDPVFTRNIWMVTPTYFLACRIFEDSGFKGRLRAVPEGNGGADIDFLREGLRGSEERARAEDNSSPRLKPPKSWNKMYKHVIYCVPTFSNPSSRSMTLERREELVRLAREYDALIITDDVYDLLQWEVDTNTADRVDLSKALQPRLCDVDRFLDGGHDRKDADGFGNAVSNGSFSKISGPGCRTGWAEGSAKFAYGLSQVYVSSALSRILLEGSPDLVEYVLTVLVALQGLAVRHRS
jgi:DNA-binding transcriptional MocR family regulator